MPTRELNALSNDVQDGTRECIQESIISFQTTVPVPLKEAMHRFIDRYPNWDQYRLIQAALAGFLVQNGFTKREITRLYIGNMFDSNSLLEGS